MKYEILGKPDFPCVKINLNAGESIVAESGAMVAMSTNMEIKTESRGGIMKSLKRSVLGGESFFINTFTASDKAGEILLTSATMGDLEVIELSGNDIILSTHAFVCSSQSVSIDSTWGGFRAFFGGEGLFFLKASGSGTLFFSSFGAIHQIQLQGEYIVDTGHIVAFDPSVSFTIEKVGGLKSLFLSGEGLVCRFSGSGRLWIQTRNQNSFAAWADQFRRVESSDNSDTM
ncbi:MAG TPA: TIGR00266 family protein [Spirochaetota bacterium]|nr:TIGR00266 family protein [Spirochaetota bacterium]HOM86809.1 TIGR00266 family protein [Spirochaetota bacterium]HOR92749.1 TIGR00266 family protein [Spirochaetota bacterium]HOT18779.1 TIGR00266 family protein [Spirochaetota bacterium]HPD04271.1 TIGR00266 family protein [Spirochaetota bacterium]